MAAPKGNKNAKRPGIEKKVRIRVPDPSWMDDIQAGVGNPTERGIALMGYLLWKESPEHDDKSFVEWIALSIQRP